MQDTGPGQAHLGWALGGAGGSGVWAELWEHREEDASGDCAGETAQGAEFCGSKTCCQ